MKYSFGAAGLALALATPLLAQPMEADMHAKMMAPMVRSAVEADAKARFAMLDANKDGVVTEQEAATARAAMRKDMADKMFAQIDTNKDGTISRAEFEAHLAHMGGPDHGAAAPQEDRMFGLADANKDGKVTLAEASALALAHFDAMDTNKDGRITPEERHAAWMKMRDATKDPHAGH